MSANTAAELINYMSSRLLEVAELNTVLDQFGDSKALPTSGKQIEFIKYAPFEANEANWKFAFKSLVTNSDWIRTISNSSRNWDLGGFDFGDEPGPLEIRELSAEDRMELESMELF